MPATHTLIINNVSLSRFFFFYAGLFVRTSGEKERKNGGKVKLPAIVGLARERENERASETLDRLLDVFSSTQS